MKCFLKKLLHKRTVCRIAGINDNNKFEKALPTIYNMIDYFKEKKDPVDFEKFRNEYLYKYADKEKDKEYIEYIEKLWNSNELFELTKIRKTQENKYIRCENYEINMSDFCKWNT